MGIDVIWKGEDGKVLDQVGDPHMLLSRFVQDGCSTQQTSCLRFLDPIGDACFNQLQIPVLIREFRTAVTEAGNEKIRLHLEKVLKLAERAAGVHTYLWFIGD